MWDSNATLLCLSLCFCLEGNMQSWGIHQPFLTTISLLSLHRWGTCHGPQLFVNHPIQNGIPSSWSHLRVDPHHSSLTPTPHPSHPGQFDSNLLLEKSSLQQAPLPTIVWDRQHGCHAKYVSPAACLRESLCLATMNGGENLVWASSSFSFICIHKLQLFRLQLTLQSLPYVHRRIKKFECGGTDANLPPWHAWGHEDSPGSRI